MNYGEFKNILYDTHEDYISITEKFIEHQDRYHTYFSKVFKQKSTNKFFEAEWGQGSTESQWCDPSDGDWTFTEFVPVEKTKTIYKRIEQT